MTRLISSLSIVALVALVIGCSSTPETKTDPMLAAWHVVELGSKDLDGVDAAMIPTLAFDVVKQTVSGMAGCNTYSGSFSNDINALSFGKIAVTKKECPGEAMSIETQFLDALAKTATMKADDDELKLFDASGAEILKAKAKD